MKATLNLRKLSEADVTHVSLVKHAANRIGFRIVKSQSHQENQMLNLSTIIKGDKKKAAATIAAVVIAKNDEKLVASVREALKIEGLDFPITKSFEDGTTALAADSDFEKDATVFRVDETMAFVVKGFEPYGKEFDDLSFADQAQTRGYYNLVRSAMDVLSDSVHTSLYKSDSPDAAGATISKVTTEFQAYVTALTKSLPTKLFKSEEAVSAILKSWKPEEKPAETDKDKEKDKKDVKKAEMPEGADKTKWDAMSEDERVAFVTKTAEKPEDKKDEKPVASSPELAEITKAVSALTGAVSDIAKTLKTQAEAIADVKKSQETSKEDLAAVTRKAEDAAKLIKGTVVGGNTTPDPEQQQQVKKSEDDNPYTGVFDTAFIQKREVK